MNTSGRVYLFGAGGHAKVIAEILEQRGAEVGGFFDDGSEDRLLWSYPVAQWPGAMDVDHDSLIVAIGDNATRQKKAETLAVTFGLAVHPETSISARTRLAAGTVVMAGAVINADTTVGAHCIVNTSASIDHDCVIEDYAHISPNTTLCGGVRVGEGTHVGAGAIVIPGTRIGSWAVIGAGSVVIRDVPDGATAVGNPAKPIAPDR